MPSYTITCIRDERKSEKKTEIIISNSMSKSHAESRAIHKHFVSDRFAKLMILKSLSIS